MKRKAKSTGKGEWLYAGLLRFAEGGERNLRVERIADDLGVTKGSYYHYFESREDFIEQMLDYSLKITTGDFIESSSAADGPLNQLRSLIISVFKSRDGKDFDFYLRDFARRNRRAAKLVKDIDGKRIAYIRELLIGCGLTSESAAIKAEIIYNYYLGWHARNKDGQLDKGGLTEQFRIIGEIIGFDVNDPRLMR